MPLQYFYANHCSQHYKCDFSRFINIKLFFFPQIIDLAPWNFFSERYKKRRMSCYLKLFQLLILCIFTLPRFINSKVASFFCFEHVICQFYILGGKMLPKPRCELTHATSLCRSPVSKVKITKKMALLIIFDRLESSGLPVCVREESPISQSLPLLPFVLCTNDMQCPPSSVINSGVLLSW